MIVPRGGPLRGATEADVPLGEHVKHTSSGVTDFTLMAPSPWPDQVGELAPLERGTLA
jgi:hypothetical protein